MADETEFNAVCAGIARDTMCIRYNVRADQLVIRLVRNAKEGVGEIDKDARDGSNTVSVILRRPEARDLLDWLADIYAGPLERAAIRAEKSLQE